VLHDVLIWMKGISALDYEYVVCLQPSSPLRWPSDIQACLTLMDEIGVESVASRVRVWDAHPARMQWEDGSAVFVPAYVNQRRQDLPACYLRNGAIYATRSNLIRQGRIYGESHYWYEMPKWRSINIDDDIDLVCCRAIYDEYHRRSRQCA
jgi:CMP-N,N'-diacetyllegionaminic acid synthase